MNNYKIVELTQREKDVVMLVMCGKANKEIARELGLSIRTTEHHITQLLKKLGLTNRTEMAIWAYRHFQE